MTKSTLDRLPPHSLEAEQGILGCVILSPLDCMGDCSELISTSMFYDLRHQIIYEAFLFFFAKGIAFDLVLLSEHLKENKDKILLSYLAQLPDTVPSAANLRYYIDIVREKFLLRNVIGVCTEGLAAVRDFNDGDNATELVDKIAVAIHRLSDENYKGTPTISELVRKAIDQIESFHNNPGKISGMPTGFAELDRLTWGLQNGELIIIAGRPSTGKTALAMQITEFVSVEHKIPVGVFSLEMQATQLILRMLCSRAKADLRRIRDEGCYESDFPKLTSAAGKISVAPIYLDDQSGLTFAQLASRARRMVAQYGIKLLVVDYLQLLATVSNGNNWGNRQQEIAMISSGLKGLAKELDIPVVALSQLNRELDKDKGRKPRLSDLRESGALEQDADLVGMLYKRTTKDDEPNDNSATIVQVNLDISKQRNGPIGYIELMFHKSITRFESKPRIDAVDIPEPEVPLPHRYENE